MAGMKELAANTKKTEHTKRDTMRIFLFYCFFGKGHYNDDFS